MKENEDDDLRLHLEIELRFSCQRGKEGGKRAKEGKRNRNGNGIEFVGRKGKG